jgi:hypothetical protein
MRIVLRLIVLCGKEKPLAWNCIPTASFGEACETPRCCVRLSEKGIRAGDSSLEKRRRVSSKKNPKGGRSG